MGSTFTEKRRKASTFTDAWFRPLRQGVPCACVDPDGESGVQTPLPWKITKGSSAILIRIPGKITNLPSQDSMLGHWRPPAKFFAGRHVFHWLANESPPLGYSDHTKKPKEKNVICVEIDPPPPPL